MKNVILNPQSQAMLEQRRLEGTDLENIVNRNEAGSFQGNPIDAFSEMLSDQVNQINGVMQASDTTTENFLKGEDTSIHEVMIAMSKADVSFRLMAQVGRKVLEAYQEISRMQV